MYCNLDRNYLDQSTQEYMYMYNIYTWSNVQLSKNEVGIMTS